MTPPENPKLKEGWFKLANASKWHYFTENGSRSLCRKWAYLGNGELESDLTPQTKPSPDECKVCWRRLRDQIEEMVDATDPRSDALV